jgi:hypothetical protein
MERRMSPHACPPCSGHCAQGRACRNGSHLLGSDWPRVYDTERARQADSPTPGYARPPEQFEAYLDEQCGSSPRLRPLSFTRPAAPRRAVRRIGTARHGGDWLAALQRVALAVALLGGLMFAGLATTDFAHELLARVIHSRGSR